MAFDKTIMKDGEPRVDFVRRRLQEGASPRTIFAEMNAPERFAGTPGRVWPMAIVQAEQKKLGLDPRSLLKAERATKAELTPEQILGDQTFVAKPALDAERTYGEKHAAVSKPLDTSDPDPLNWTEVDEPAVKAEVPLEYEGVLNSEDVAEVKAEAAKSIRAEMRKVAREKLLKDLKADLKREAQAEMKRGRARGDMVDVNVDLAPFTDRIILDGEVFMHGRVYRVSRAQSRTLQEQCFRTWTHQEEISGQRNANQFFKEKLPRVSPQGVSYGVQV